MTVAEVFLGVNALGVGGVGVSYLYDPNLLLARYGLEAKSASMDNMLRGAYGGLFVGMAAIFACGALVPTRTADALLFTVLFMGGFLVGRVVSVARVGAPSRGIYGLLAYEVVTSLAAGALYLHLAG